MSDFMRRHGDRILASYRSHFEMQAALLPTLFEVESPIEEALLLAFSHLQSLGEPIELAKFVPLTPHYATIIPQCVLGPYRADFAVFVMALQGSEYLDRTIIVECDGHDWHERTKQMASRDKARDRYFAERGMLVMRFTGSEIWRDPISCAEQVVRAVHNLVVEFQIEVSARPAIVPDDTGGKP